MIVGVAFFNSSAPIPTTTRFFYPNNNNAYVPPGGTLSNYGIQHHNIGNFTMPSDYAGGNIKINYNFRANINQYNAVECGFYLSTITAYGNMLIENVQNGTIQKTGSLSSITERAPGLTISAGQTIYVFICVNYPYRTVTNISVSFNLEYNAVV